MRALALWPALLAGADASHWPMPPGARWELALKDSAPMVFEVTRESGGFARVRWDNPWVKAEFGFRSRADAVELAELDMGQGVAPMPVGTVYFDFGRPIGTSWSNALGTISVAGRDLAVDAPAGRYRGCIEIRARDGKGVETFWTFAPGVGPVRFGRGAGAYLLSSYRQGGGAVGEPRRPVVGPTPPVVQAPGSKPWIGIDANPTPGEGYSTEAKRTRARMAREAGANLLYYAPKWKEFSSAEFDERIAAAAENGWPVALNLRIVDTHTRSMPAAVAELAFDDARMAAAVSDLIRDAAARAKGRVRWLTIGNEVNEYFKSRRGEVEAYARLLDRVAPVARKAFPNAKLSVNFSWFAMGSLGKEYAPLVSRCDFVSLTYYPLNADLTFRPPSVARGDIASMVRAAGGKKLFLQEVGYASSSRIRSSEAAQAEFLANAFAAFREQPDVLAANFVWMSDLPDSVVNDLAKYYALPGNANFREYLGTLGYFDKSGRAKPAWEVFRREASR